MNTEDKLLLQLKDILERQGDKKSSKNQGSIELSQLLKIAKSGAYQNKPNVIAFILCQIGYHLFTDDRISEAAKIFESAATISNIDEPTRAITLIGLAAGQFSKKQYKQAVILAQQGTSTISRLPIQDASKVSKSKQYVNYITIGLEAFGRNLIVESKRLEYIEKHKKESKQSSQ